MTGQGSAHGGANERIMVLPNGMPVVQINEYETRYLFAEIFTERQYLPDDLPSLPPAPAVFDAGANIGLFSLYVMYHWPDARVYAFEPVPGVYDVLARNLAPYAGAHPCKLALGRFPGYSTMSYYPGFTMMSGLRADRAYDRAVARTYLVTAAADAEHAEQSDGAGQPGGQDSLAAAADELLAGRFSPITIGCELESVSGAMRRLGVGRIDLLKIDVERYELDVLLGIEEQTWPAIGRVVVEVDDRAGELDRVTGLLTGHGLRCQVRQAADYRATSLFMVHALRQ